MPSITLVLVSLFSLIRSMLVEEASFHSVNISGHKVSPLISPLTVNLKFTSRVTCAGFCMRMKPDCLLYAIVNEVCMLGNVDALEEALSAKHSGMPVMTSFVTGRVRRRVCTKAVDSLRDEVLLFLNPQVEPRLFCLHSCSPFPLLKI